VYLEYYGFIQHSLGATASPVELALYDLSQGAIKWVPPALLGGHHMEGIWHSGVRVFGKELWFGGAILESNPDNPKTMPFGNPTRLQKLGVTLRSEEELMDFIRKELYMDYNMKSYDMLRRNCNHFAHELVQFLLPGHDFPAEVLMQPEWAKNSALVSVLQPVLNQWLGGFGDAEAPTQPGCGPAAASAAARRIDDLTQEWRHRLEAGDMVLHRKRFIDRPWVVRIESISGTQGARTAGIVFFRPTGARWEDVASMLSLGELWVWEVVRQSGVPLCEFYPLLEDEPEADAHHLRLGHSLNDARVESVLQRLCLDPFVQVCPRGHCLQDATRPWFLQVPSCSICNELSVRTVRQCPYKWCGFGVCEACLSKGCRFRGGGVFCDILTPSLAQDVLGNDGWLKYKASSYFFKADHNGKGFLDRLKMRRVITRLVAEIGIHKLPEKEVTKELSRLRPQSADGDTGVIKLREASVQLDESAFKDFFQAALSLALAKKTELAPAKLSERL